MKNKITDLRNHLFETIEALKDPDNPMEVQRAKAIYETAQTIIESGKLEVQFIEVVGKGENSHCFGHIAHYDIDGFYDTWFTRDKHRLGFLRNTLSWVCFGDPKFTYSDVERVIQQEVRARNYLALYELRAAEELRNSEMATLM